MLQDTLTARRICEDFLEITRLAMLTRDSYSFASCFALPHYIDTFDGCRKVTTIQEIQDLFAALTERLEREKITDIVRRCLEAEFTEANKIICVHETRNYLGDLQLGETTSCVTYLERLNGVWQIVRTQYAIMQDVSYSRILAGHEVS